MKHKKMLVMLLLIALYQLTFGNSIFSFEGMPSAHYGNDAYGLGMGNTGYGDLFRVGTNYQNPAMTVTANKVIFSTAVRFGYLWYLEQEGAGYRDNELHFPYFTFAFPASKHRFGIMYQPYLSGYVKNQKKQSGSFDYHEHNRISETINKMSLLYAYRLDFATVGLAANYFIGHQIRFWEIDFDNPLINNAKYENENSFKNFGFSAGLSKKHENFSWSIGIQSGSMLKGDKIFRYNFSPGADTLKTDETLFEIPPLISLGYTQKLPRNFKVSSELHYELWNNTGFYEKNSYKIGIGASYDPIRGYGKWYEKIPLRIGGFYRLLPFTKNNTKIEEKAFTWGFSIPFVSPEKQLDFACEYILRGDENVHGVREKIMYFTIGINGFDIFSRRPKKTAPREIPEVEF